MDSSDLAIIRWSACRRWNTHLARFVHPPPVEAFQECLQLCRRQSHDTIGNARPAELAILQPLGEQAYARAVEVDEVDAVGAVRFIMHPLVRVRAVGRLYRIDICS